MERAAAADLAGLRAVFRGLADARVVDVGAVTAFAVDAWPDHPWCNALLVHGPVSDAELDEALSAVRAATAPLVSTTAAHDRPDWREGHGFTEGLRLERMAAPSGGSGTDRPLVTAGPGDADVVVQVCAAGFGGWRPDADAAWWRAGLGQPGWTQLLAYDGGVPVATGALHVAGPAAYVGGATTVPGARGRGWQTALLAARLRLAAQQGATEVTVKVEPGGTSQRNLARHGFVTVGSVTQWRQAARGSAP